MSRSYLRSSALSEEPSSRKRYARLELSSPKPAFVPRTPTASSTSNYSSITSTRSYASRSYATSRTEHDVSARGAKEEKAEILPSKVDDSDEDEAPQGRDEYHDLRVKIRDMQRQITAQSEKLEHAQRLNEELNVCVVHLKRDKAKAVAEADVQQNEKESFERENKRIKTKLQSVEASLKSMEDERRNLAEKLRATQNYKKSTVEEEREIKSLISQLQSESISLRQKNSSLESRIEELNNQLRKARVLNRVLESDGNADSSFKNKSKRQVLTRHFTVDTNGTREPIIDLRSQLSSQKMNGSREYDGTSYRQRTGSSGTEPTLGFRSDQSLSDDEIEPSPSHTTESMVNIDIEAASDAIESSDATGELSDSTNVSVTGSMAVEINSTRTSAVHTPLKLAKIQSPRASFGSPRFSANTPASPSSPSGASLEAVRIENLKIELESKKKEVSRLQESNATLNKRLKECEQQVLASRSIANEFEALQVIHSDLHKSHKKRIDEYESRKQELVEENEQLRQMADKTRRILVDVQNELTRAKEETLQVKIQLEKSETLVKKEIENKKKLNDELAAVLSQLSAKEAERATAARNSSKFQSEMQTYRESSIKLEEKNSKLEREIKGMEGQIATLNNQITVQQNVIDEIRIESSSSLDQIAKLTETLGKAEESQKKSMAAKKSSDDQLNQAKMKISEQEHSRQAAVSELERKKSDLSTSILEAAHMKTRIEKLQVEVATVSTQRDELARENDASKRHIEDLNQQIQQLQDMLSAGSNASAALGTEIQQQKHSSDSQRLLLEQQIQSLNHQKQALENQKQSLESHKFSLESQKQSLEQQKQTLEQQRINLEQQNQLLTQQKQSIEQKHATLESEKQNLSTKLGVTEQERDKATSKLATAEAEKSKQWAEFKKLATDLNICRQELQQANQISTNLNNQLQQKEIELRAVESNSKKLAEKQEHVMDELRTQVAQLKKELKIVKSAQQPKPATPEPALISAPTITIQSVPTKELEDEIARLKSDLEAAHQHESNFKQELALANTKLHVKIEEITNLKCKLEEQQSSTPPPEDQIKESSSSAELDSLRRDLALSQQQNQQRQSAAEKLQQELDRVKADSQRKSASGDSLIKKLSKQCEHWQHQAELLKHQLEAIRKECDKNNQLKKALESIIGVSAGSSAQTAASATPQDPKLAAVTRVQALWRSKLVRIKHKNLRYRWLKAKEIMETEESYLKCLDMASSYFLNPFESMIKVNDAIIPHEDIETLFSSLESIRKNNKVILANIKSRFANWHYDQLIGDIFSNALAEDLLQPHVEYIQSYQRSCEVRMRLTKESHIFSQILSIIRMLPPMEGKSLEDLLINPIQRIPRYILLMNDMVTHTHPSHPDFINLQDAHSGLQRFATFINENNRRKETMTDISAKLIGYEEGLPENSERVLLNEGRLTQIANRGEKYIRQAFLFNDYIVFAKETKESKKNKSKSLRSGSVEARLSHKFVSYIKFSNNVNVIEIGSKEIFGTYTQHVFNISVGESPNYLQANTEAEMKVWVLKAKEALESRIFASASASSSAALTLRSKSPGVIEKSTESKSSTGEFRIDSKAQLEKEASSSSGAPTKAKRLSLGSMTPPLTNPDRSISPARSVSSNSIIASIIEEDSIDVNVGQSMLGMTSIGSSGSIDGVTGKKRTTLSKRHKEKNKASNVE